jgi:hypothetical protein
MVIVFNTWLPRLGSLTSNRARRPVTARPSRYAPRVEPLEDRRLLSTLVGLQGANLIRFDSALPGTVTTLSVQGLASGDVLQAVVFDPATDQLLGIGSNNNNGTSNLYVLDPNTGAATLAHAIAPGFQANSPFGKAIVAFDPVPDGSGQYGILVLSSDGSVVEVLNPADGTFTSSADPNNPVAASYDGGAFEGPSFVTGAFSNPYRGATATTLYALDPQPNNNVIKLTSAPGQNAWHAVGPLGLTSTLQDAFAIGSGQDPVSGKPDAFAALPDGTTFKVTLFRIDLQSGSATALGVIGNGSAVSNLVVLPPSVSFTASGQTVTEGAGQTVTITATLSEPSQGTVTVPFTVGGTATNPTDYTISSGSLTFAPGTTSKSITLTLAGDTATDGDETAVVTLGTPTNAVLGSQAVHTVTLHDAPRSSLQFSSPTYSATEAGGSATVQVTRTGDTSATVTVHYATSDGTAAAGTDYSPTSGDLTFNPGDTSKTFTVNLISGAAITGTETVNLTLSNPGGGATLGGQATAVLDVTDPVTGFVLTAPSALVTAGTPAGFTVTAQNAAGAVVHGYRGTVHLSSSDGQASLPADYTLTAADNGAHAFNVALKTAGSQSITVADAALNLSSSQGVTVNPAAASRLALSGLPTSTAAGAAQAFTVTARDPFGNVATGYNGTVHFSSSDALAALPNDYPFAAADAGTHSFGVTLQTAGTQSLSVTDGSGLTTTQGGITVSPAAASSLTVTGLSASSVAGTDLSFTVSARDAAGNPATGYRGTVHFSSSDGQAGLPSDYTFTAADNGAHTFSATLKTAGSQSLIAADPALNVSNQGVVAVGPAAASALALSGFPVGTAAGAAQTVTVTARDPFGNVATGYDGTAHFTSSDSQATLPADYAFTTGSGGDDGTHTFTVTLRTPGTQSLTVTGGSLSFTQSGITVTPGGAATLSLTGFPSATTAGVTGTFTVTARDASGDPAVGYRDTVHLASSDGRAVFPVTDYTFTAADAGAHTFSVTLETAGFQSLSATDTAAGGPSSAVVSVSVSAANLTRLQLSAPDSTPAGSGFTVTVTAQDAFGNPVGGYRSGVHFTSSDALAQLPSDYSFQAADNGTRAFHVNLLAPGGQTLTVQDDGGLKATAFVESVTAPGGSPNQRFVAASFAVLLGRPADGNTLFQLGAALDQGTLTRYQLTQALTASDEHRALVVRGLYRRLLGRDADPGALNALVPLMAQGITPEQVEALLVSSPEYFNHAGGTNDAFLRRIYQDVFGRPIDPGAEAALGDQMARGASQLAVALELVFSDEGRANEVNGLYQGYLGRPGTAGEIGALVPFLRQGVTDDMLAAALVQSDEFFARGLDAA